MNTATVVEKVSNLVDAVGREHAEQRHQAFAQYRELLMKNHKPTEADAEQLHGLIDTLRLTPDDMRDHLALLQEAERHEAISAESDEAQRLYDGADEQAKRHAAETKKIAKKRVERQAVLDDERMTTLCRCKDCTLSARLLEKLHDGNRELFGLEEAGDESP